MTTSKDLEQVLFYSVKNDVSLKTAMNAVFPNRNHDIILNSIKNIDASFTDGVQFVYSNDRGTYRISMDVILRDICDYHYNK